MDPLCKNIWVTVVAAISVEPKISIKLEFSVRSLTVIAAMVPESTTYDSLEQKCYLCTLHTLVNIMSWSATSTFLPTSRLKSRTCQRTCGGHTENATQFPQFNFKHVRINCMKPESHIYIHWLDMDKQWRYFFQMSISGRIFRFLPKNGIQHTRLCHFIHNPINRESILLIYSRGNYPDVHEK